MMNLADVALAGPRPPDAVRAPADPHAGPHGNLERAGRVHRVDVHAPRPGVGIAMIVVTLPAFILNTANMTAHTGMLLGDPLGMPSYIKALTFVTFTLCSFMGFYVSAPSILHNYYVYGSIEAKEQERQQQKSEIQ